MQMNFIKYSWIGYIVCIFILMLLLSASIHTVYDIIGADELSYLKFGKMLFNEVHFEWGFMYSVWYKILSIFQHDTVKLYYLNYRVLIISVPVLLCILLMRYRVNNIIAFGIAVLYGISKMHITTWPFVSNFCLFIFLIHLIINSYLKTTYSKAILLVITSFLLYLTRPEYLLAFIPAFGIALYYTRNNKKYWIVICVFLVLVVYIQLNTSKLLGLDRSFFAFAQHYFLTYKIWNRSANINAYDYLNLAPKLFGNSYTLMGTVIHNPLIVLQHIFTCIGMYFISFIKTLEDVFVPSIYFKSIGKFKHVVFFILIVITFYCAKKSKSNFKINENKFFVLSITLFYIGGIVPNFLIGYSPHYIQLHFLLILLVACIFFLAEKNVTLPVYFPFVLIALCFLFRPSLTKYSFQDVDYKERKNLPVQRLIRYVNTTNDHQSHTLLAYQTNLHYAFDGNNFKGIDIFTINKPFIQFIEEKAIDYIYINEQLTKDDKLNKDAEWHQFYANPEKYGFKKQALAHTENYLLIKND